MKCNYPDKKCWYRGRHGCGIDNNTIDNNTIGKCPFSPKEDEALAEALKQMAGDNN